MVRMLELALYRAHAPVVLSNINDEFLRQLQGDDGGEMHTVGDGLLIYKQYNNEYGMFVDWWR